MQNNFKPATEKQLEYLRKVGYEGNMVGLTIEEASQIIAGYKEIEAREAAEKAQAQPSDIFSGAESSGGYAPYTPQPEAKPQPKQEPKAQTPVAVTKNAVSKFTFTTALGNEITLTKSVVDQYICKGLTEEEFHYFFNVCRNYKLNPFLKDIYAIKFGSQAATFIIDYKVLQQAADNEPTFDGLTTGIIYLDSNGKAQEREGSYILPNEKLIGAWCIVHRKDRGHQNKYYALYDENVKLKDGKPNTNWATKPVFMITKVAKAQALRETYPNWFSNGTYTQDEFDGVENDDYKQSGINAVSDEQNAKNGKRKADIDIKADDLE